MIVKHEKRENGESRLSYYEIKARPQLIMNLVECVMLLFLCKQFLFTI